MSAVLLAAGCLPMSRPLLTRNEIQERLREMHQPRVQLLAPPVLAGAARDGEAASLTERLYASADRDEQERLLSRLAELQRANERAGMEFTARQFEKARLEMESRFAAAIEEAVAKARAGGEAAKLYAEAAGKIMLEHEGSTRAWKGHPPRGAQEACVRLAEALKTPRHLFPEELWGRVEELLSRHGVPQERRPEPPQELFTTRNPGRQQELLRAFEDAVRPR